MIKMILSTLLYTIITLFIFNNECLSSSVYGPKIFGLQLGMPENEVTDVLNTLAKEYNGKIFYDSLVSKDNKYLIQVHIVNKKLYRFNIWNNFFDISNLNNESFIRDFCNHYSIPLDKMYKNSYTNIEDGYKIIINYNSVSIETLEKSKPYTKPKFK